MHALAVAFHTSLQRSSSLPDHCQEVHLHGRSYLDEASNPESLKAMSCPVSPCLRQLRPVLLHAQHLLEEVSEPSSQPQN